VAQALQEGIEMSWPEPIPARVRMQPKFHGSIMEATKKEATPATSHPRSCTLPDPSWCSPTRHGILPLRCPIGHEWSKWNSAIEEILLAAAAAGVASIRHFPMAD
jgi:hypothetical protein